MIKYNKNYQDDKIQQDPNQWDGVVVFRDLSWHYEALHPYALYHLNDKNPMLLEAPKYNI